MSVAPGDDLALRPAVSDSLTVSFADPTAGVCGLVRLGVSPGEPGARRGSALAVLFSGREVVSAHAEGDLPVAGEDWGALAAAGLRTTVQAPLEAWSLALAGDDGAGLELELTASGDPVVLDGDAALVGGFAGYEQPCRVRGRLLAGGRDAAVDALGQRGRAWGDADWGRVGALRTVAAWTEGPSATLVSVRPAGADGHDRDATWAALWEPDGAVGLEAARLSTTYDADGRTRSAGLELWPASEEGWPRRGAGEVVCGSSLTLGALRLDCAFLRWHLEGRAGVGRYDLLRRVP